MKDKLNDLERTIADIEIRNPEDAEEFRIKYLSRKGILNDLFEEFKTISPLAKKETGLILNALKQKIQKKYAHNIQYIYICLFRI